MRNNKIGSIKPRKALQRLGNGPKRNDAIIWLRKQAAKIEAAGHTEIELNPKSVLSEADLHEWADDFGYEVHKLPKGSLLIAKMQAA